MRTTKTIYGETPHGGIKSIVYYFNENREACNPNDAKYMNIVEYDENDNRLFEVYGMCNGSSKNDEI